MSDFDYSEASHSDASETGVDDAAAERSAEDGSSQAPPHGDADADADASSQSCEAGGNACNDCSDGFRSDGPGSTRCVDIDECEDGPVAACGEGAARCDNEDGGYRCGCRDGYTNTTLTSCMDIDECIGGAVAACGAGATACMDTEGSYQCTCDAAYELDPDGRGCHPAPPPVVLSPLEQITGEWRLARWTETPMAVTLYVEAEAGRLTVAADRAVDWHLDIDEVAEDNSPQPGLKCGGRFTLSGTIVPELGAGRNAKIDWTRDLDSVNYSSTGGDWVLRALCGRSSLEGDYPYSVATDGSSTQRATYMEMTNMWGTFVWLACRGDATAPPGCAMLGAVTSPGP